MTRDELRELPQDLNLRVERSWDVSLLSALGRLPVQEVIRRLANDHTAYVAWHRDVPAAFGWVAAGKARIGELGHEFIVPEKQRYLWNFRTLEEYRGLGIYPRLLQYIVKSEVSASRFWILHAPENESSRKGIEKAGFRFAGSVSPYRYEAIVDSRAFVSEALRLGFTQSAVEQATCWKCSSPYMSGAPGGCCCSERGKVCNGEKFRQ